MEQNQLILIVLVILMILIVYYFSKNAVQNATEKFCPMC